MACKNKEIGIVIVNYNGYKDTIICLESLYKLNYTQFKIIVVDNSPNDNSVNHLKKWAENNSRLIEDQNFDKQNNRISNPSDYLFLNEDEEYFEILKTRLTILKVIKNRGFSAANNVAMRFIKQHYPCDVIWLLNNDTFVDSEILNYYNEFLLDNTNDQLGIVGTNLYNYDQPTKLQSIGGVHNKWLCISRHLNKVEDVENSKISLFGLKANYIIGASMFVPMHYVVNVGLMEEIYFLYYEDVDWAIRGNKKGYKLGYASKCNVYHKEGATIGSGATVLSKSSLSDFYGIRNKLLFTERNYPKFLPFVLFSLILSFFLRVFYFEYKRAFKVILIIKWFFTNKLKDKYYTA